VLEESVDLDELTGKQIKWPGFLATTFRLVSEQRLVSGRRVSAGRFLEICAGLAPV
jgi:hypothetical protein